MSVVRTPRARLMTSTSSCGVGAVDIVTRGGWATVYVKGRRVGATPRRLILPAGRVILELRPFGRRPARRIAVSVRAGQVVQVVVDVTP